LLVASARIIILPFKGSIGPKDGYVWNNTRFRWLMSSLIQLSSGRGGILNATKILLHMVCVLRLIERQNEKHAKSINHVL
jgi:hypothetical protein